MGKEVNRSVSFFSHGLGSLVRLTANNEHARTSFMSNQNCLTIFGKQHQIPFPMTGFSPLVDVSWPPIDRDTPLNAIDRTSPFVPPPAALAFSPSQVVPPTKIIGASNLSVDESIDRLLADHPTPLFLFQSTADLGRRPTLSQPLEDLSLKSPASRSNRLPRQRRLFACCSA